MENASEPVYPGLVFFFSVENFGARGNFEKSAREIQKIARGKSQVKFATGKNGHKILPPKKINNGKFW